MDIIASHQWGLIEQLQEEASALAGRRQDAVQRAIAYHHLYQHSDGANGHALLAAAGALKLDETIGRMARQARWRGWRLGGEARAALLGRVAEFGETLRALDARRCESLVLAYRLAVTPGLGGEARRRLAPGLLAGFTGGRSGAARRTLFLAQQALVEDGIGVELEQAIVTLGWPLAPRAVAKAITTLRVPLSAFDRAEARGWGRVEAGFSASAALPPRYAANPGRHYYALQRALLDKQRKAHVALCELEDTVRLAA